MWDQKLPEVIRQNTGMVGYQDLSFLFTGQNVHNLYLCKLLKDGQKIKLNVRVNKAIEFLGKVTSALNSKFNLRYMKFIYGLYYNFLLLNCRIFLTKNYKVVRKERKYFYSFLLKKQRTSEIFKWNYYLLHLQYDYKIEMRLAWLFFEFYYYYEVSELNSIKLNLLASFSQQKKSITKSRKKRWALGRVIRFYS